MFQDGIKLENFQGINVFNDRNNTKNLAERADERYCELERKSPINKVIV